MLGSGSGAMFGPQCGVTTPHPHPLAFPPAEATRARTRFRATALRPRTPPDGRSSRTPPTAARRSLTSRANAPARDRRRQRPSRYRPLGGARTCPATPRHRSPEHDWRATISQSETWGWNSAISASVTVGASLRHATHSSASVSPPRGELIAGGRSLDQPPDQPAPAQRKRWEHVLAAVAADAGRGRGLVVRAFLRKTPDSHPQPTSLAYSPSVRRELVGMRRGRASVTLTL